MARRVVVLLVTPWIALMMYGTARASAAPYNDPARASTVQALPAQAADATPHGATRTGSPLALTATDALVLVCFLAAIVVPGVGLVRLSRRQPRDAQHA